MSHEIDLGEGARIVVRGVDDDGSVVNADVVLTVSDGTRWVATVLTLGEVARLMDSYRESGECQSGTYFRVPDLLILNTGTVDVLVDVFRALVRTGGYRHELVELGTDGISWMAGAHV
ncbi:hypothetical protein GCM10010413_13770 [Promicromonospora sukumoe]|uniref:Uncharacterized protein n=1 Tax=Promicromonospora sukumoe TaxID=88382 RepID=A0A7W3J668_9MICO|nr:hypothetical protein [Promicromonospora sukumoe]MBA8807033.1 hypothetical protein [Promicromonospora sukumoe]